MQIPALSAATPASSLPRRLRSGFRHPSRTGTAFDPTSVLFAVSDNPPIDLSLPEPMGERWFHLALELRPDGSAALYIDREQVAESFVHLPMDKIEGWTVRIAARAVGTEVYVRDVVVWGEARFGG